MRNRPLVSQVASLILAAACAASAVAQVSVTVDATQSVRVVDNRQFGVNTPFWDLTFPSATSLDSFNQMGTTIMRFGGGSATDDYDWSTNKAVSTGDSYAFNVDGFAVQAHAAGAQAIITTNYGSGTPAAAAAYVTYANVTKGYGFKYWEIGNECYGTWENDLQSNPHDPYTYGTRAAQYITAMKAADPTIKVGVVADASEDSYANGYTAHPATNPRTSVAHNGWTPVMLATMKAAGVLPDFLIYHRYEQNQGSESDSVLLQDALTWPQDAATLRGILTDYLGTAGAGIELLVTENNSVSTGPGKQSVSLVNGLYYADSTANLMQTEFNALTWWDFHNGQSTTAPINLSSSLYGWRMYGDYGVEYQPTGDRYPTFYVAKLLTHFARGGDTVIKSTSSGNLLSTYAARRQDGTLSILVINKSPTVTYPANFTITGYAPKPNATVYSYGMPQDIAAENAAASTPASGVVSTWNGTMDGWVNQSALPDDTTTNYGLTGTFQYSLSYSTTTGVTDGSSSLACATTAANPGDNAVIQNSTASMGTSMSTAASVSLDVYPQGTGGGTLQVSFYINGTNIPYARLGPTSYVTLNPNQENTVTFTLTDAQRAGIAASLGSGKYFQVGININAAAPLTVYFDKFSITQNASSAPTPTPVPGGASSPDVAVSSISNAGATFSASFAPYSATVISLSSGPQILTQPSGKFTSVGGSATFTVTAAGSGLTYQWYLNGTPISGATLSSYTVTNAQASDAGTYTVMVTDSQGTITSFPVTLSVNTGTSTARLTNISTRATVGTGANILIPGLYISGSGTETLLIRADGPALTQYGVSGVLAKPTLSVFNAAGTMVASNTGWGTDANAATIPSISASVGAFPLPAGSADCALIANLGAGGYTVQISGVGNTTGVALAEVYEVSATGTARLANISTRATVGTGGNILIPGFYIAGSGTDELLIRADGPALTQYGVGGVLAQPTLSVFNASGTMVASNTAWGTGSNASSIPALSASLGAFSLTTGSADSAEIVSLAPGGYTIQVSGVGNTTGVALAEIYEVP